MGFCLRVVLQIAFSFVRRVTCSASTSLRGCFLHDADNWEKIPILEPRAIGYRTGPKNGVFFPMAVERHPSPRKKVLFVHLIARSTDQARRMYEQNLASHSSYLLAERSVSDGNLCGPETREGPWAGGPRGGVLYRRP